MDWFDEVHRAGPPVAHGESTVGCHRDPGGAVEAVGKGGAGAARSCPQPTRRSRRRRPRSLPGRARRSSAPTFSRHRARAAARPPHHGHRHERNTRPHARARTLLRPRGTATGRANDRSRSGRATRSRAQRTSYPQATTSCCDPTTTRVSLDVKNHPAPAGWRRHQGIRERRHTETARGKPPARGPRRSRLLHGDAGGRVRSRPPATTATGVPRSRAEPARATLAQARRSFIVP